MWKWTLKQLFGIDIPIPAHASMFLFFIIFLQNPAKPFSGNRQRSINLVINIHCISVLSATPIAAAADHCSVTSFLYFILLILTILFIPHFYILFFWFLPILFIFLSFCYFFFLMPFIWYMYIEFILWLLCHVMIKLYHFVL